VGIQFANDDFQLLLDRYAPRIENFRSTLRSSNKAIFILRLHKAHNTDIKNIERLWQALQSWRLSKPFMLVCINTYAHDNNIILEEGPLCDNTNIKIFNINYPHENYVWHSQALSLQGYEFEKKIFDFILPKIEEWDKNN